MMFWTSMPWLGGRIVHSACLAATPLSAVGSFTSSDNMTAAIV
jgi:hypothetical protein